MTLELKTDKNEFEKENSHDETSDKKYFACMYSSEQYLLIVNCFSKYNKFGLTINYRCRACIESLELT